MSKQNSSPATSEPTKDKDELTALREEVMELRGLVEALNGRVDLLESAPQPATVVGLPLHSDDKNEQITGKPNTDAMAANLGPDAAKKWSEITERRQAAASARNRRPSTEDSGKLNQVLNEIEGVNLGAARVRLDALKVKGVIGSYMVLPPGSVMPSDVVPNRLRVTVDQYQVIIRAEMG